jgi:hypothetical protein
MCASTETDVRDQRTTALSLAAKATVVAEKRCTRSAMHDPCPHTLNAVYLNTLRNWCVYKVTLHNFKKTRNINKNMKYSEWYNKEKPFQTYTISDWIKNV